MNFHALLNSSRFTLASAIYSTITFHLCPMVQYGVSFSHIRGTLVFAGSKEFGYPGLLETTKRSV